MEKTKKRDSLWIILFLIVLINGFEAGGYQASLWSIGKDFDLSIEERFAWAAVAADSVKDDPQRMYGIYESPGNP